jgi:hypothetical protein
VQVFPGHVVGTFWHFVGSTGRMVGWMHSGPSGQRVVEAGQRVSTAGQVVGIEPLGQVVIAGRHFVGSLGRIVGFVQSEAGHLLM